MTANIPGATPDELFNSILVQLRDRSGEALVYASRASAFSTETKSTRTDLELLGRPNASLSEAHAPLRNALAGLLSLSHGIELVTRESTVLQRAGIDLAKLFEPKEINYGIGNRLRAEQHGPARLVHAHEQPCLVADTGHLCIDIPLKIEKFGVLHWPHLNVTLAIDTIPGPNDAFQRILTRGAHFCPLDGLEDALAQLLIDEIRPELAAISGRVPLPRLPELPIGKIDLWAGTFGELVRVHGRAGRRSRRRVPPLSALRNWADTGIKIVPDLIVSIVQREVAKTGAGIVGGPRYVSASAFDMSARMEMSGSRRVGCKRFGYRVRIDFTIRTQLRIDAVGSRTTLVIDSFDVARDVDVTIEPRVIDWLLDELVRLGERWLEKRLPSLTHTQRIDLPMARRAAVEISANGYILEMQTRQLFQA